MNKYFKILLITAIVLGLLIFTLPASASDLTINGGNLVLNSNTNSATLTGLNSGTLGTSQSSSSGIGFGSVTIFMATTISPISATDNIRTDDNRGTAVGWKVNVSATNLTATVPDATTALETDNVVLSIPANTILTATPQDLTANNSSDLTNVTKQNPGAAVSSSGITVASAAVGYGAGSYLQQLDYTLSVPNYLPDQATVTPDDAAQSKFANRAAGSKVPLLAGTYTTTVTYAVSTGP